MRKVSLNSDVQVPWKNLTRHDQIKQGLKAAGSSISKLSSEIGVAASTLTIVSQGYRTSDRIQRQIAEKLGLTAEALFPERYPTKEDTPPR